MLMRQRKRRVAHSRHQRLWIRVWLRVRRSPGRLNKLLDAVLGKEGGA